MSSGLKPDLMDTSPLFLFSPSLTERWLTLLCLTNQTNFLLPSTPMAVCEITSGRVAQSLQHFGKHTRQGADRGYQYVHAPRLYPNFRQLSGEIIQLASK